MNGLQYYLNKKTDEILELKYEYIAISEEYEEEDDLSKYADWGIYEYEQK